MDGTNVNCLLGHIMYSLVMIWNIPGVVC